MSAQKRQQVWYQGSPPGYLDQSYQDGPDIDAQTLGFQRYYADSPSQATNRHSQRYPTTSSNHPHRDDRLRPVRQRAPIKNDAAAFKQLHGSSSPLWVTTYPYFPVDSTRLFGGHADLLFHVHVPPAGTTVKPVDSVRGWFASVSSCLGFGAAPPTPPPRRTPLTRKQFARAPIQDDRDDLDVLPDDDKGASSSRFVNDGPIFRPSDDILYLDRTFWKEYLARLDLNVDIFVPGVFPDDLAQTQKLALDIVLLRNRDEFAAVCKAIGRHLPSVQSIWAIVTRVVPRPANAKPEQIAHLDRGLPGITDKQKVRLGVHDDPKYVPTRGAVTAHLSHVNILAGPGRAAHVQYMLLTFFRDAWETLHGKSTDVDLWQAGAAATVQDAISKDATTTVPKKAAGKQAADAKADATQGQTSSNAGAGDDLQKALDAVKKLKADRRKQQKANKALFDQDHPRDVVQVSVSGGRGATGALAAIVASWDAAIPRIAKRLGLAEAGLRGWMNAANLQAELEEIRRSARQSDPNFTIQHAAAAFRQLARRRTSANVQLGQIGPLIETTMGGNNLDRAYQTYGLPQLVAPTVWIYYNNNPDQKEYRALQDKNVP